MLKKIFVYAALATSLIILSACSGATAEPVERLDPLALEAAVQTVPDAPVAGSPVKLSAIFSGGGQLPDSARMEFEIRQEDQSVRVQGENAGNNTFEGIHSFSAPGEFEVYVHLYGGDFHVTKMQKVTVQ
ncbi:hypothetical protein [Paenibacillus soyae]|uniref:YtkA-like domain-containing protein n=1 Tax=Paenibacillus soyae TaxID=2969249 RepID=A0A9X2S6Z1_9BACL|nr:hypothetical protein [Paenibacillus soyae]MCR2802759.1 hypothetical protein [Paenibacillus soyae]